MDIQFKIGAQTFQGVLNGTATAGQVAGALPFSGAAQVWGQEIYFEIPVRADLDQAQTRVAHGDVAYWPPGRCLCLFFGQQPVSAVNVIGRLQGDLAGLGRVRDGEMVMVEMV